ncbi:hypothetical protein CY0110_27238 [Crocosphaera chwakensis CCY0110]|uniref:Uncharacterized protein n=1 Tax=Crocosphaera chwakensis CCY0110 TaxID=391612 RepID=A3IXY8_9CHRO|nr:hypothetical protein CY0110_27238 [Crocosphaera chwakensis CCY0110]
MKFLLIEMNDNYPMVLEKVVPILGVEKSLLRHSRSLRVLFMLLDQSY